VKWLYGQQGIEQTKVMRNQKAKGKSSALFLCFFRQRKFGTFAFGLLPFAF
jgi:hypothetical protein